MKKSRLLGAVCGLLCMSTVQADLIIQDIYLKIDKPDYNAQYSVGVEANISSDLPLLDVTASHVPYTSGSSGTWDLDNTGGNRWWGWDGLGALYSAGTIDGLFTVTASDGSSTASASIELPPDAELDFIRDYKVSETSLGYHVTANSVFGADYYDFSVWDPIDRVYAFSQTNSQINEFDIVPYASLLSDREYTFSLRAINLFTGGTFRTISHLRVTYASVPIPASVWLFGSGLLGLIGMARWKRNDS